MQRDDWRDRDWRGRDGGDYPDDADWRERERWEIRPAPRSGPRHPRRGPDDGSQRAGRGFEDDGPRRADDIELWGRHMDHEDWERGSYGRPDYFENPGRGQRDWRAAGPPAWRGTNPAWNDGGGRAADRDRGQPPQPPQQWDARGGRWSQDWRMRPSNPYEDDLHRGDTGGFRDLSYGEGGENYPMRPGPAAWSDTPQRPRAVDRGVANGPSWWNDWRRGDWSQGARWSSSNLDTQHRHGRTQSRHYQRSDERIREDIYDRLADHPDLDSQEIEVTVSSGEVTLRGSVDDRWEKRLAEDVAESVSGVSYVSNELRYAQGMGATDPSREYGHATQQPWNRGGDQASHRIQQGMHVVGIDGEEIGQVQDMRDGSFTLGRSGGKRPLYVPSRSIQSVQNDQVVLTTRASEVESQGWESATLLPSGAGE